MKTVSVCIPSWGRPDVRTLRICPSARLYVDAGQAEEYRMRNPSAEIVECAPGIHGNIARVRNHILRTEFGRGAAAVCMMDDDISSIFCWHATPDGYGYNKRRLSGDGFLAFVEKYTALAEELGFSLWGMNCIPSNRAYRHGTPFSFENIVLGPFSCHLSSDFLYDETIPLKEDYDIFLQHIERERGVLRLNFAAYENGASELKKGGCSGQRNKAEEKRQFIDLQRKWGGAIVTRDRHAMKAYDINPIIRNPIEGA